MSAVDRASRGRLAGTWLAMACALLSGGCATIQVSHQASVEVVQGLRDPAGASLRVGEFRLAAGLSPSLDKSISSRGNPINPPAGQTFSGFLRSSAIADLQAAGRYDEQSALELRGELTESSLDTGMSKGTGALAAHFTVVKGGATLYDRTLRQAEEWPSSFVGAIAIPEAMNRYNALYGKLLAALWADDAFKAATRR